MATSSGQCSVTYVFGQFKLKCEPVRAVPSVSSGEGRLSNYRCGHNVLSSVISMLGRCRSKKVVLNTCLKGLTVFNYKYETD